MNNSEKNFCKNVTLLRKMNNLSQKEMAQICHIGLGSLQKIESGIIPPKLSANILFRLYRHFHIPIKQLFKDELF